MMDFDVISVRSVEEALEALSKYEDDARVIAGGQSLLNILKQGLMAPEVLVDIHGVEAIGGIEGGDALRIGAGVTHRAVEQSDVLRESFPIFEEMERHLATVQIRNWGTLGGNLCIADPTGDAAPCLLVHDAAVRLEKKGGGRDLPLADFFVDYYETVLEPDELLTQITVPRPPAHTGSAYEKFRNVEGDAPIIGAAARITLDAGGQKVEDVRIALGGAAGVPLLCVDAEKVLRGQEASAEAFAEAAEAAPAQASPIPDITASAEFKTKLTRVLVKRVLEKARARARNGKV
jgi:carbon-monoxide dehydrogenase medium subunit